MGRSSAPTRPSHAARDVAQFRIGDVIEVRTEYGAPAPGFILVAEGLRVADPSALAGRTFGVVLPSGWTIAGEIRGARDHGPATSIMAENWPDDLPRPQVGWHLAIDADLCEPAPTAAAPERLAGAG